MRSLGTLIVGACMAMLAGHAPFVARAERLAEGAGTPASAVPREDMHPAAWLDSAALGAPRFGVVKFIARDGTRLSAFIYRATGFEPQRGPIWFVHHGAGRNAEAYLRGAAPVAERHNALAIAIEFPERAYPSMADYTLGVTTRGRPDANAYAERRWREPDRYVYAEVEHVFEAVRRFYGGHQQGYYLFGHSAGAQFVHRLLTFLPDARVLGAVAANAGWYTLPVSSEDANHAMPYGLRGTPLQAVELRSLFAAPLTVMLGAQDIAQADADSKLRGTPGANAQGATRLARGQHYFATARAAAAKAATPFHWRLAIVPHAAHEFRQVMGSAAFFLFESGEPCVTQQSASPSTIAINEILADPPQGTRGDANADGVRDSAGDEFVELVNVGAAAVCLAGWTLGDASDARRHVFPLGPALLPGEALVVFGGGVPTGGFGGARVQWAAFGGRLDLSNAGDVLTIRDAAGGIAAQMSWGDCGGQPCAQSHYEGALGVAASLVRSPDKSGRWKVHSENSRTVFSPGLRVDGSRFPVQDRSTRGETSMRGERHEQ